MATNGSVLTYSNNSFIDNGNGTATLKPNLFNNNYQPIVIEYTYQEDNSPCAATGYLGIRIEPNPVASFGLTINTNDFNTPKVDSYCEGEPITFVSSSTITGGAGTITGYDWDFGDVNAIVKTSKVNSPLHTYGLTGNYQPTLFVTSNFGCASTVVSKDVSVGIIPTAAFSFVGVSTADNITFTNTTVVPAGTVNDGINLLEWDLLGNGSYSKTGVEVSNKYTNVGKYLTVLKVTSKLGCTDTLKRLIAVLPQSNPVGSVVYDFETDQGWQTLTAKEINPSQANTIASSWKRAAPTSVAIDPVINKQRVWKTENAAGKYNAREKSYLYSPSFDIKGIKKPLVSFNSFYDFETQDGVVLQYSIDNLNITDPNKKWVDALGKFDAQVPSGYNWYNDLGLTSKPGDQTTGDYGWTKSSQTWKDSRHSLSMIDRQATRLVFRFALGSTSTRTDVEITKPGFALDNFTIGERTRFVLLESFSNLGNASPDEKNESKKLKELTGQLFNESDILNINYHVAFPQKDPFNLDNPDDPSARALFYDIKISPRSRLDGFNGLKDNLNEGDPLFSTWLNKFNLQQLKLAEAEINLTGTKVVDNGDSKGTIEIPVKIKALRKFEAETTILHVGVLEKSIKFSDLKASQLALINATNLDQLNSEFVLKKMLPSAAGTKFINPQDSLTTKDYGIFTWTPDLAKLYPSENDLYAFAFLQNSKTREVYQAQLIPIGNDPKLITGLENLNDDAVSVYPNPATKEFTIELPFITSKKVDFQLFDPVGRVVYSGQIGEGQRSAKITTEDFSNGIYIIQLNEDSDKVIRKKVMVVKE